MMRGDLSEAISTNTELSSAYDVGIFWRGRLDLAVLKKSFSWAYLNHVLSTNRITNDRLRLSIKDAFLTPNKKVFQSAIDGFGRPTDYLLVSKLHRQLKSGATAVFEAIHEIFPELERLTDSLSAKYYARSAANAYISFGTTSGFGVHNDDHDVLVLQVEGRKRWNFFSSPDRHGKATVRDLTFPSPEDIGERLILSEGDILLIPKGTWHDVEAVAEPSLHLTISLVYPSIYNYLEWILKTNKFGLPYRDIRFQNKKMDDLAYNCKSFFDAVISEESIAKFTKMYYSRYPSIRYSPCFPGLNTPSPSDHYQKIPFLFLNVSQQGNQDGRCHIQALGKNFQLSQSAHKLLGFMQVGKNYSGSKLLAEFPELKTLTEVDSALQELLDEGLITKRNIDDTLKN